MPVIYHHKPTRLTLTESQIASIKRRAKTEPIEQEAPQQPQMTAQGPSLTAKAKHAGKAVARLVRSALKGENVFVRKAEKKRRAAICRECPYWNEAGNAGLGECMHKSCGCTRSKQSLATEVCPIGKW